MSKITGIEKVTNTYINWKPSDVAFIKYVEWSGEKLALFVYSQLRNRGFGWPDLAKDFFEISMHFYNVSNFKLEFLDSNLAQVSGFDIVDISTNGREKKNFQIEDYENGIISFTCEYIEIEIVSPPVKLYLNS